MTYLNYYFDVESDKTLKCYMKNLIKFRGIGKKLSKVLKNSSSLSERRSVSKELRRN